MLNDSPAAILNPGRLREFSSPKEFNVTTSVENGIVKYEDGTYKLIHTHTEVVVDAVAPTCTETGLTEGKHCSVCGEVIVAQTVVPAKGHSYTAVVTAPTFDADGYTTYTCACGDSYVVTNTGSKLIAVAEYEFGGEVKKFTNVHEAIAAAKALAADGITEVKVALVADADIHEYDETVSGHVTLDLNGYTLTVHSFVEFDGSHIIDSSTAKTGLLKVAKGNIRLSANNKQMPIYDTTSGGYRFADVSMNGKKESTTADGFKIKVKPSL